LVSRYLTNKLIGRGPISRRRPKLPLVGPLARDDIVRY
jgi:hypothetical protein